MTRAGLMTLRGRASSSGCSVVSRCALAGRVCLPCAAQMFGRASSCAFRNGWVCPPPRRPGRAPWDVATPMAMGAPHLARCLSHTAAGTARMHVGVCFPRQLCGDLAREQGLSRATQGGAQSGVRLASNALPWPCGSGMSGECVHVLGPVIISVVTQRLLRRGAWAPPAAAFSGSVAARARATL